MDIVLVAIVAVFLIAAAAGPIGVLMGVRHSCERAEEVGEHDPIEAMEGRGVQHRHV